MRRMYIFFHLLSIIISGVIVKIFQMLFKRTAAIITIRNFKIDNTKERIIIVAYPHSILEPVVSEEKLKSQTIRVRKGELVSHDFLKETLIAYGFERCDFVTEPGISMHYVGV